MEGIIKLFFLILVVDLIVLVIFYRANRRLHNAIEGRKKAELDLKENQDRLALALLSSGIGIWDLSLTDGKMIWDEGMYQIFGMQPGTFEGTRESFRGRILTEDLPVFESATLAAMEGRAPFEAEFRIRRKDDQVLYLRAKGQVYREEHNAPFRMLGVCENITASREAREKIRQLSQVVEQSPIMVIITDLNGQIEYVNDSFSEITGYSREDALGRNPRFLRGCEQSPNLAGNLWSVVASGKTWKGEFCNRRKNGEIFWVDSSISPVLNNQKKVTHFMAIQQDITTRKEMEKALQDAKNTAEAATEVKGQFLANMSHEIRTPMNAIVGLAYLCQQTELTPRQSGYLKKITVAADNLLGIINEILDFSKAEAGKITLENIEFDLDDILDQLSDLITGKAQEKGLEVVFLTAPDVPARLIGDPLRLEQILINLANNAVKYTPSGEIVISSEVVKREDNLAWLRFTVRDTGIGMTEEQQQKIFNPFTQADSSITRRFGGTGLGLAICKRLIDAMNGEIKMESALNHGSAFSITVKLPVAADRQPLYPTSDLRGLNVLVIDDSESALNAFRSQLQSLSFAVSTARSLEEASERLLSRGANRPFDLVFLDWKFPGISGSEAIKAIKKATLTGCESGRHVPIISVVPFGQEIIAEKSIGSELEALLIMPFTMSTLLDTILTVFHKDVSIPRRSSRKILSQETLAGLKGLSVLLVEDNEINQDFASELLVRAGIRVEIADNGMVALRMLEKNQFDCVLMDVQMPEMDGYAAARAIRLQEKYRQLPIVAMTAGAMSGDREKALQAGMNDYITKPIDPQMLFRKLLQWSHRDRSVTSVGEIAQAAVQELPKIPGMDAEASCERIGGNIAMLVKVLKKFCLNHADTTEKIQNALKMGQTDEARILAHNLAGVSGNLGVGAIEKLARSIEEAIVSGQNDSAREILIQLEIELRQFIAAAEKQFNSEPQSEAVQAAKLQQPLL
ncbi:MAG: diguanylate cyclase/phosphodiesterase (GGDEF & EAL domains) with PAS/PAC sensor(s) [Candidatus Rifleibacterium amylolyticum]|nr:MAG: diguanylate cyclase/phosphodiesterase (GGDEF & EAL domains) with PAS/PAC sensor(s) [Candidatus Rifleibacterium amylolyticum]